MIESSFPDPIIRCTDISRGIPMSSHKILGAVAVVALFVALQDSAEAQYYSGTYSTFYQPYTSYYSGPTTAYYGGSGGSGYGYTSYYGGSYGYGGNPFAPLVSSPYGYGWGGWFGSGYTAAYGPYGGGCCSPCATGCSPCATGCGFGGCSTGGCATGNCSIPTGSEQMKPSPDNGLPMNDSTDEVPRTYDEPDTPPMDDPGFRSDDTGTDNTGTFPGAIDSESFKIQTDQDGIDLPGGTW
jgi:hypothetical protein